MVNWTDPVTIYLCARAFTLVVCCAFGIYIWEVLISLNFDIEHFTGKRPIRWTFVAYLLTRYLLLLGLIAGIRVTNVLAPIDCVIWNRLVYACAHGCFAFASLLLLLRVIAIAEKNMIIIGFLGTFYAVNLGLLVHGVTVAHSIYVPELFLCGATNTVASRVNVWASFGFDLACLFIMLYLLLRQPGGGFWRFLVNQGFVYFLVATGSYLLPSVFLIFNLNDAMNELPQTVSLTTMVICATRMYRQLSVFDEDEANRYIISGEETQIGTRRTGRRGDRIQFKRDRPGQAGPGDSTVGVLGGGARGTMRGGLVDEFDDEFEGRSAVGLGADGMPMRRMSGGKEMHSPGSMSDLSTFEKDPRKERDVFVV
ncbi:hypothetical protein AURDEDRAFT_160306 [Auricularia subglabra TFB-10046 SS5]|nr:hypothetical protein AURDEDRAFT_160306 [Auricularia subglabra TFB-10046 SS5]